MVNLKFPFGKSTNLQRCPQVRPSDKFRQWRAAFFYQNRVLPTGVV